MSRLLADVYLHRLDREWEAQGTGELVRYADDLDGDPAAPARKRERHFRPF